MFKVSALVLALVVCAVSGFPDGAPVDACVKPRPNEPYHGQARTQPLETNPYAVVASASHYQPGSQITGKRGSRNIDPNWYLQ